MVTIKVQSSEDIIKAYFTNLGFRGKDLQEIVTLTLSDWEKNRKGDILDFLDAQILKKARIVFPDSKLAANQLSAKFKLGFIISSKKSRFRDYITENLQDIFSEAEKMKIFAIAPDYNIAEMKPQKIETSEVSWFGKILNLFGKD